MIKKISAVIFYLLITSAIMNTEALAQTKPLPSKPLPSKAKTTKSAIPQSAAVMVKAPTPTPAPPAEVKSPIKMVYTAEYEGARLGANLATTQGPTGDPDTATITHDFRLGYAISKSNVIGVREKVSQNLQLLGTNTDTFVARDWRGYFTWSNMIDTPDVGMTGVFDVLLPTSDGSIKAGKIFGLNIKNNWSFKTQIRNWSFDVLTIISPQFFQDPTAKTDLVLLLIPMITVDISSGVQLYFELDMDAAHKYTYNFYDFNQGDPDFFNIGPIFQLNPYISLNPALRFYTGAITLSTANLYLNFTAAL